MAAMLSRLKTDVIAIGSRILSDTRTSSRCSPIMATFALWGPGVRSSTCELTIGCCICNIKLSTGLLRIGRSRGGLVRATSAHAVDLRNDNWRFGRNKFASSDDIDDLIAESAFSTWAQDARKCISP